MLSHRRRGVIAPILALALLVIAVLAVQAGAADPKPAPCAGVLYTDPPGDTNDDPSGEGVPTAPVGDQTDITSVFLNGNTANVVLKNLTETIPPDAGGGVYYYFFYTTSDGTDRYVDARLTSSGWSYYYGHLAVVGFISTFTNDGQTTGSHVLGPDGVVSVVIPPTAGGAPGTAITKTYSTVDLIYAGDDASGWQSHADTAPDDTTKGLKDATITPCPAGSGGATGGGATPTATPSAGGGGGGGGAGATPTPSAGAPAPAAAKPLPFKITSVSGSSKKGLKFKVKAGAKITSLLVQFRKAGTQGPVVAKLKAAAVKAGVSTLKLKKAKKLKKGKYSVLATGRVAGTPLSTTLTVKVKK